MVGSSSTLFDFPECITVPPHIVGDPCLPRWVVQCSHGQWFWYHNPHYWKDKRNERGAWIALTGLVAKIKRTHN